MIELADIISVIQNPIVFIRPIMDNPWLVYPVLWAIVALESYFVLFAWMPAETTMFLAGSLAAHPDIPIELWLCGLVICRRCILAGRQSISVVGSIRLRMRVWTIQSRSSTVMHP